jgi:hypothetical protein
MKRVILLLILCLTASCTKETVVDDFIEFGNLSIDNKTTYDILSVQLEGNEKRLPSGEVKLEAGPNKLKIWGLGSTPQDTPVALFDTVLHVAAKSTYNFVLFQANPDVKPVAVVNNQAAEPKPEAGFMKIKIANLAPNCFPGTVDMLMKMIDYNSGDLVDLDIIKEIKPTFGEYVKYSTLDETISDGFIYFFIVDPVTQEPSPDMLLGVDLMNSASQKFYTVLTLYISERESSTGIFTGTDGKQYDVEVKSLFSN